MRAIDPELQARLDSGVTTLCRCWAIVRRDGVVQGFTDHDKDLSFDGVLFKAETGMTAEAVERTTGLSVDNGEAVGALSSFGLRDEDLAAGLYDGAAVSHWIVDWSKPDLRVLEFRGTLGEIRRAGGAFEVELRGLAEPLNHPVGRAIIKTCDRELGDGQCGIDLTDPAYAADATVEVSDGQRRLRLRGLSGFAAGWFTEGDVVWQTGANAGRRAQIRLDTTEGAWRRLDFWEDMPWPIAAGDAVRVVAGCDKRVATCRDKFANILNFRGFPHVPGEDWVTAYPQSGGQHNGGSLLSGG